ncbi:glycosyltransferase family 4 protein [Quatrionicoccus australiensis]|uniref:glycosyltransferase family 4 protein n=1 Tax=Quatrionicoccus australiensis TaxID=138118 RepID=UPI001CF921E9|nr:glycosyltransferase family 4 protein [Quatrionicoccus australiensis]UCV15263.1 glycosyltransferase family 4 protein [Quatrionicoccus australiensis]
MKPKNVLYVYSGKARAKAGGLDLVVRQQLQALVESGYKVTFVSRGVYEHPLVRNVSLKVTPAHVFSSLRSKYYYNAQHRFFSFLGGLLLRVSDFDMVISWAHQSKYLFGVANGKGVKTFLNCPASYAERKPGASQEIFLWPSVNEKYAEEERKRADFLLTPSDYARNSYISAGFSPDVVFNIGRGADIQRFSPETTAGEPFRLVFFGLVCDRKGIVQALEAWRRAAVKNGEFWIIGHLLNDFGLDLSKDLPDGVFLKGFSNSPEKYIKQCHVQILPTRHEGMAKSLVEGAACGLVTITTPESGFPVLEGETGYFVSRDDVARMSELIRYLADNPVARCEMAKKSRKFVEDNLTWPIFRERFVSVIKENQG